jgi:hypothetical protein
MIFTFGAAVHVDEILTYTVAGTPQEVSECPDKL